MVVLLFADQNLLAPNLSAIAEEFGFDGAPEALSSLSVVDYCCTLNGASSSTGDASTAGRPAVCAVRSLQSTLQPLAQDETPLVLNFPHDNQSRASR